LDPVALLAKWGLLLVFSSVLLEHGGLPLPAAPLLIAAGALAQDGDLRPEYVLLVAMAACLLADHVWFLLGRKGGRGLLASVCRLSLSPDTCVRRTDDIIARHGAALLLVAKFIPGVSAVAIPTAAAMGLPYRRFLFFDAIGCAAWCGCYVGLGMIFSREVNRLLDALGRIGGWSLLVVGGLFALYIGLKVLHRARLKRLFRLVRISPEEAAKLLEEDPELIIVDARSRLARDADPREFPRSITYEDGDVVGMLPDDARGRTIITFCTCPNEASAALLAERLIRAGYRRVRVLTGGADAVAMLSAYSP
jgi:membrane protein DedA with SNARE-associated domain/rhodanese-related sulfurtransferase